MQLPIKNKLPYLGLLLAFSLVLSYLESLVPLNFVIPGIKLGLPNFAIVLCLYLFGNKDALVLTILKVILISFLFGNAISLVYSLSGAILSILIMIIIKRSNAFTILAVSALGGVFFNIGQLLTAYFIINSSGLWYYVPFLLVSGLLTGMLIGFLADLVLPKIKKIISKGDKES